MSSRSAYQTAYNKADPKSQDYYNQLENISQKQRFGLFTQPPPLAVADKFEHQQNQGQPINFLVNPKLEGRVEPTLFQVPSSILQGDPYKDPYKAKQIKDKERVATIPHSQPFKNTDNHKTIIGSQYEHMKEYNDKIYDKRDENGNIITGPKNFLTNPTKAGLGNSTVGHLFNRISYESDPYNRAKESDIKDRAFHKSKILDLKKPFINSKHGEGIFNSNRVVYGLDRPITEGKKRTYNYPGVQHLKAFRNADIPKQGYNKTIGRFPQYSEEGDVPRPWKKTIPSMTQRAWIFHTRGTLSKPCPSIVSMSLNKNKISQFRR